MKTAGLLKITALVSLALTSGGCSINRAIGNQVNTFSLEHVLPAAMQLDDITMICHSNESFVPLLSGFGDFQVDTDLLMSVSYAGAAMCTQNEAQEKELWSAQAEKQGWISIAKDARIAQQLLNRDAGVRQLKSYKHMANYFRTNYNYEMGEGKCPQFHKDIEQQVMLVGATSALQALQNDIASGRLIDVDMGIPAKIGRAMQCLDNDKWWGVPKAVSAALVTVLPENAAAEAKAWEDLQAATDVGLQSGVRLTHAVYASMAYGKDKQDLLRDALKRFEAIPADALNPKFRLLDQMAAMQIRHIADRYWMNHEGHRAPTLEFSRFWDERKQNVNVNQYNDILDNM